MKTFKYTVEITVNTPTLRKAQNKIFKNFDESIKTKVIACEMINNNGE